MVYRLETIKAPALIVRATRGRPFGPGFTRTQASAASTMEVWGSGLADPEDDYCEFRLLDRDGALIAARQTNGY